MLLLWLVLILTVKKSWLAMNSGNLYVFIHVSIPASLCFGNLCVVDEKDHKHIVKLEIIVPVNPIL